MYICPFCFKHREGGVKRTNTLNGLRQHILSEARAEELKYAVNDHHRIHDPAIFTVWEAENRVNCYSDGHPCPGCNWTLRDNQMSHVTKWFYCNRRYDAQVRVQMIHRPREGEPAQAVNALGPIRMIISPKERLGLFRDPQRAEREQVVALVRTNLVPPHLNIDPAGQIQRIISLFKPARQLCPTALPI